MKFASSCTALAAALSASYRTYDEFQVGTPLEDFLDQNGVLLTMCMRFHGRIPWLECTRGKDDSRLSASWVQVDKTKGFRVIGKPVDVGPPIGLVLKPSAAKIRCVYPVDAATDARDDDGCGSSEQDPKYGSKGYDHADWIGKLFYREQIIQYRNANFGKNRTFDSIPCSEFVTMQPALENFAIGLLDEYKRNESSQDDKWRYLTYPEYQIELSNYIMGHPVCNQSQPAAKPDLNRSSEMLLYPGHQSWSPDEWPMAVQLMENILDRHPNLYVWNELVMEVPTGTEEEFANHTVQAVFYIQGNGVVMDEISRRLAHREANRMQKPLFYVDLPSLQNPDEDLFHCPSEEDLNDTEVEGGGEDKAVKDGLGSLRGTLPSSGMARAIDNRLSVIAVGLDFVLSS